MPLVDDIELMLSTMKKLEDEVRDIHRSVLGASMVSTATINAGAIDASKIISTGVDPGLKGSIKRLQRHINDCDALVKVLKTELVKKED